MRISNIAASIILLTSYFLLFHLFSIPEKSVAKLFVVILLWGSLYFIFKEVVVNRKMVKDRYTSYSIIVFYLLMLWNLILIMRSIFTTKSYLTLIANIYFASSFLVPLTFYFATNIKNILRVNLFYKKYNIVIIFTSLFLIYFSTTYFSTSTSIFWVGLFAISVIHYYSTKDKIIFTLSLVFIFLAAVWSGSRAMMLRLPLILILILSNVHFPKRYAPVFFKLLFTSLLIPLYIVGYSLIVGVSPFQKLASNYENEPGDTRDTRTFLYTEVLSDLNSTNDLFFGRGADGTYYSSFFADLNTDSGERPSVEVGVLAMMVKGGICMVIFHLLFFGLAIYYALFKSNNLFVKNLGIILIVHVIFLFIEEFYSFNLNNFFCYFIAGICLSKEARVFSDTFYKSFFIKKSI